MTIAILYEDNEIFVKFSPEEFTQLLSDKIFEGLTVEQAMIDIIKDLKHKTLTA